MKITTETAEHYTWGQGCDGWHLLKSAGLSVIYERMPPGTQEIKHYHRRSQQLFFVVAGELEIARGTTSCVLYPGEGLTIEPGAAHQVHNRSTADVWFIVVSQPPSHGDRVAVE